MGAPDKMFVTADCVTFCYEPETGIEVLLVQRANEPYKGQWALPGGFVDLDEDLDVAARRELLEETGIEADYVAQVGAFGKPGRDPRGRNVTVGHAAVVGHGRAAAAAADDAADARWFPLDDLPDLAFDHDLILDSGVQALASMVTQSFMLYLLLPEIFTLDDLRSLVSQATGMNWEEEDALDLMMNAVPEMVEPGPTPEESYFRCSVDNYDKLLPDPESMYDEMERMVQQLGYDSLDQALDMMGDMDDYDMDQF